MGHSLHNDQLTVTFSEVGGELSSIKDRNGLEYLWQADATYWGGQAPVLFPICGSLRQGQAHLTLEGQTYQLAMPRHGVVRKRRFEPENISQTEIAFSFTSDEKTYAAYPFHFKLTTCYKLEGSKISTSYEVTNRDTKPLPFCIGGHPAFNCPLLEGETFEDYYLAFDQPEPGTIPRTLVETGLIDPSDRRPFLAGGQRLDLTYDLFEEDALVLEQLVSRKVSLKSDKHNKAIHFSFDDFPNLLLWTSANQGPFIALEPWCGLSTCTDESDDFLEKRQLQILEAGETRIFTYVIEISS